eukprot:Partr_v1_DN27768_c0_g1_i1_m66724 putative Von willebrand factor
MSLKARTGTSCGLVLTPAVFNGGDEVFATVEEALISLNVIDIAASIALEITFRVPAIEDDLVAKYHLPLYDRACPYSVEADINGMSIKSAVSDKDLSGNLFDGKEDDSIKNDQLVIDLGIVKTGWLISIKVAYAVEVVSKTSDCLTINLPAYLVPEVPSVGLVSNHGLVIIGSFQMSSQILSVSIPSAISCDVALHPEMDYRQKKIIERDRGRHASLTANFSTCYVPAGGIDIIVQVQEFVGFRAFTECNLATNTKCTMLTLSPKFKQIDGDLKCEFVFVLDMTDFMNGQRSFQLKQATMIALYSLPIGSYFNIVVYGKNYAYMQPFRCSLYSSESLGYAISFLENIEADMGSCRELFGCFTNLFTEMKIQQGFRRQIFLICSGEINHVDKVTHLVRTQTGGGRGRLFTIGLGREVSKSSLERLAHAGAGEAGFCGINDHIERKLISFLRRSMNPCARNFRIRWIDTAPFQLTSESGSSSSSQRTASKPGLKDLFKIEFPPGTELETIVFKNHFLRQSPADIGVVNRGKTKAVYALSNPPAELLKDLSVTAASTEGPIDITLPIVETVIEVSETDLPLLHTLAARSLIRDLEDGKSYLNIGLPCDPAIKAVARPASTIDPGCVNSEIVRFSKLYNIVSSNTAFVATDAYGQQLKRSDYSINIITPYSMKKHAVSSQKILKEALPTPPTSMKHSVFSFMRRSKSPKENSMSTSFASFNQIQSKSSATQISAQYVSTDTFEESFSRISSSCNDNVNDEPEFQHEWKPPSLSEPHSLLLRLINTMEPSGKFNWSESLIQILAASPLELNEKSSRGSGSINFDMKAYERIVNSAVPSCDLDVWATVLALAFLIAKMAEFVDIYSFISEKSRKWLIDNAKLTQFQVSTMDELLQLGKLILI